MAYYNRLEQTKKTLESFKKYNPDEFNVVIVDDGSREECRVSSIIKDFDFQITDIYLDPERKTWVNPCVPFNVGFRAASGQKIIIQNPECYHKTDIISHVRNNLNDSNYISYPCYSLTQKASKSVEIIKESDLPQQRTSFDGDNGWYNHKTIHPTYYHFTSAITKKNLVDLGGFDERYANGRAYDDNEFLARVKRKGLEVLIPDESLVFHQWHYSPDSLEGKLSPGNQNMYYNTTLKEKGWRV